MKILIAPDSFKESLSAKEVAMAMEKGIKRVDKNIETIKIPMADGGEGTVESLVEAMENAEFLLEDVAERIVRVLNIV